MPHIKLADYKVRPLIIGIKGNDISDLGAISKVIKQVKPLGVILYGQNLYFEMRDDLKTGKQIKVQDADKIKSFIFNLKELIPELVICIDREGGKVMRLFPPTFSNREPAEYFGKIAEKDLKSAQKATYEQYYAIGKEDLLPLGFDINFAPVCDVRHESGHDVIGDRSFSASPEIVTELSRVALKGLNDAGITGCIKHLLGHGRAKVDSHEELPIIDASLEELEKTDIVPLRELLSNRNMPLAMLAHVIYTGLDKDFPASMSREVINYIRDKLDYKGLLISDEIGMKALSNKWSAPKIAEIMNENKVIVLTNETDPEKLSEIAQVLPSQPVEDFIDIYPRNHPIFNLYLQEKLSTLQLGGESWVDYMEI